MKGVFAALGFICFALGTAGVFLPVLPTVPFLLAASVCFAKGSEGVNKWFLSTGLYKKYCQPFAARRAMPLKAKIGILVFASVLLAGAFIAVPIILVRAVIILLIIFKYYYFLIRVKTDRS